MRARVRFASSTKKILWCAALGSLHAPNKIQPFGRPDGGGTDGAAHIILLPPSPTRTATAVSCTSIGTRRTGSSTSSMWTGSGTTIGLFSTNVFFSRYAGVFCESCFSQPPSIFPISSSGSESALYFLWSRNFCSHASCRKNLMKSSLAIACFTKIIFSPRSCEKLARNKSSSSCRKYASI